MSSHATLVQVPCSNSTFMHDFSNTRSHFTCVHRFSYQQKKHVTATMGCFFFLLSGIWGWLSSRIGRGRRNSSHCCQKKTGRRITLRVSSTTVPSDRRVRARVYLYPPLFCRRERFRVFPRQKNTRKKNRSTRCEQRGATPVLRSRTSASRHGTNENFEGRRTTNVRGRRTECKKAITKCVRELLKLKFQNK